MKKICRIWLAVALTTVSGRAAILLTDSFSYTNGPLVTVSGGIWAHHSGSTTGEVQVLSGKALLSQTNSEDVNAQLQGQPYAATTNILIYASFTVNFASLPSGAGTYFAHFKDSSATVFRDKIFATTNGVPTGFFRLGVANVSNSPTVLISSNLSLNTDYTVVTRYAPSNASSVLWLNPSAETSPSITATDSVSTISVVAFALRESLSSGDGMGTLYLDNLIVATSFSDVVSNPPSILQQPLSQTVTEGTNVTFTVVAAGTPPLSYQWQFNGTNQPNATNSSLTLMNVTTNQSGIYTVTITNVYGSTNSQATLTVNAVQPMPPTITTQPQSQSVTAGSDVTFAVSATGSQPLTYQWQFDGTDLGGATNSTLTLTNVTTAQAGDYLVSVSNSLGSTNSDIATLLVYPAASSPTAFSLLTYNVKGNFATNWTTNSAQVQAIGHQVMYLQPDIITFNEIPYQYTYEMANFVAAYLPGYYLATNSATDGFIRSAVVSRYPILASKSWLHGLDLTPYGYVNTNTGATNFTRDLFEARISVPSFPQVLHVFTVHLKSGQDSDSSKKRRAEASAISNYFVTGFLTTNSNHPYTLSGDMNEDIDDPPSTNVLQTIPRLENAATGLQLATPLNPITHSNLTFSIQSSNGLTKRYDYIMPNPLLFSNIKTSQVFRTDLLANPPPPLLTNDDSTASDHLPVLMVFSNPYDKPFRLTSIARSNQNVTLKWESVLGQPYRVESSSNVLSWSAFATNLTATGALYTLSTNVAGDQKFFRIYRGF